LICAIAIVAAAKVSSSAIRSSKRGSESNDLGQRARLVSKQLRADLRLAGVGSTGAIGVDIGAQPWTTMGFPSAQNFQSISAIRGANNIPANTAIAGVGPTPNWVTDAVMLVVPDPSTNTQTTIPALKASQVLTLLNVLPSFATCQMVLIVDHGSSNGGGRTQIANIGPPPVPGSPSTVTINPDSLQFDVAPGADVMCARVSTYFIAIPPLQNLPWLYRADLAKAAVPGAVNGANPGNVVYVSNATPEAPGVWDLQLAYSFSSETPGTTRTTTPPNRWAFNVPLSPINPDAPTPRGWFEVRQARLSMLIGSLRPLLESPSNAGQTINDLSAEDGAPVPLPIERGRFRITAGEVFASLRLFDKVVPSGITAEPY
jgi:hypothetical protein